MIEVFMPETNLEMCDFGVRHDKFDVLGRFVYYCEHSDRMYLCFPIETHEHHFIWSGDSNLYVCDFGLCGENRIYD